MYIIQGVDPLAPVLPMNAEEPEPIFIPDDPPSFPPMMSSSSFPQMMPPLQDTFASYLNPGIYLSSKVAIDASFLKNVLHYCIQYFIFNVFLYFYFIKSEKKCVNFLQQKNFMKMCSSIQYETSEFITLDRIKSKMRH